MLAFAKRADRCVMTEQRHEGPLVVQKILYPEGPAACHAVLIHPPGGIAGGDLLEVRASLAEGAHVVLTTPAATKWHRTSGAAASQSTAFQVAAGARLEYLPQETIIYDAASCRIETSVALAEGAVFAGWDILCLGRRASGETFCRGRLQQQFQIRRKDRLIWNERAVFGGSDPILTAAVGLGGHHVAATMIVAAGTLPSELLAQCRALAPLAGQCGVTSLPEVFVARYLGPSAERARDYFESLRGVLRPWYAGLAALRPRLWAT
jgi:urease accessory protein